MAGSDADGGYEWCDEHERFHEPGTHDDYLVDFPEPVIVLPI
jgi:hypothetical protein